MPLGLTRLNERTKRPNENLNFIKALDGPDHDIALDILERVAAIVSPIMKANWLLVNSLEEFPPNREFWGRNFNAGECIQLVLKSPTTGRWLPFQFVCKVMIHELAHNKQMNHSKAFHGVRIGFTKELDTLTSRGYTGDGFWSKGQSLSADYTAPRVLAESELPENLCGGVYRAAKKAASGEKRKLTYAERQQRRKERKFGKSEGDSLGVDEAARGKLEKGKGKAAAAVKPRVAQSQRGRDLRAEAALKRMEAMQNASGSSTSTSTSAKKEKESASDDDDDATDYTTDEEAGAIDVGEGKKMVKIADEGGADEEDWAELQDEMKLACSTGGASATASNGKGKRKKGSETETESSDADRKPAAKARPKKTAKASSSKAAASTSKAGKKLKQSKLTPDSDSSSDEGSQATMGYNARKAKEKREAAAKAAEEEKAKANGSDAGSSPQKNRKDRETESESEDERPKSKLAPKASLNAGSSTTTNRNALNGLTGATNTNNVSAVTSNGSAVASSSNTPGIAAPTYASNGSILCSACTTENEPDLSLCMICSNVLDRRRTPHWVCSHCDGGVYANASDAGICGLCGSRR